MDNASDEANTGSTAAGQIARCWWTQEDWLAVGLGGAVLMMALSAALVALPSSPQSSDGKPVLVSPFRNLFGEPAKWNLNPVDALMPAGSFGLIPRLAGTFGICTAMFAAAAWLMGGCVRRFIVGFIAVFVLAAFSLVLAAQQHIHQMSLEYAFWAIAIGMLISNTVGTPGWLRPAVHTELYIKTGLVLMGAGVLFSRLLELGPPGVCVSWIVTPIVLVATFWFGQRVLKIESKSLNIVVSADMAVCGVSAAIATAAACRAKKEELSLAIGISLVFTVIMMVVQPWVIRAVGMNEVVAGAWIGGTIDSSGAVLAAGEMVGPVAGLVAVTIKLIQNILIGVVAFGVAVYWVRYIECDAHTRRPDVGEIWHRFPKFVIGFIAASAGFSCIAALHPRGNELVQAVLRGGPGLKQGIDTLRGWFFALAFVSIGLECDFRVLARYLRGGKPVILYVCGQTLNLCLTLAMAWLMFEHVYPGVTAQLLNRPTAGP